jgi:hypothetical protein
MATIQSILKYITAINHTTIINHATIINHTTTGNNIMEHHFSVSIAQKIGVNEAIFLQNMAFWIQKNKANNKHFYEGRYWTYNSQKALCQIFPYWSRKNLRTIINSCVSQNLILTGNFNKLGYDRTTWYTLSDIGLGLFKDFNLNPSNDDIGRKGPIDMPEVANGLVKTGQPIPDNKTHIENTDVCAHTQDSLKSQCIHDEQANQLFNEKFRGYVVSLEELFDACFAHHQDKMTLFKFRQWVKREDLNNHSKYISPKRRNAPPQEDLQQYSYYEKNKMNIPNNLIYVKEWMSCQESTKIRESFVI